MNIDLDNIIATLADLCNDARSADGAAYSAQATIDGAEFCATWFGGDAESIDWGAPDVLEFDGTQIV